jgi:hypothetical protein
LAVSPSGTHLFTVSEDRSLRCWDLRTRELRGRYQNQSAIKSLFLAPTGLIAMGDVSGKLHVFDLRGNLEGLGLIASQHVSITDRLALIPLLGLFSVFTGYEPPDQARKMLTDIEQRIDEAVRKQEILASHTAELDATVMKVRRHYRLGEETP